MNNKHFIEYAESQTNEIKLMQREHPNEDLPLQRVIWGWLQVIERLKSEKNKGA
ncbi:hypothetical protein [Thalassotalea euphylliae]|uniref:hypothetical protein n=1 Tax=Thalassotalea euphylliae TaxID=1655234 RepID=UPI0015F27834|nr:hypothetical protein [Thalassotalea euphylliae]